MRSGQSCLIGTRVNRACPLVLEPKPLLLRTLGPNWSDLLTSLQSGPKLFLHPIREPRTKKEAQCYQVESHNDSEFILSNSAF